METMAIETDECQVDGKVHSENHCKANFNPQTVINPSAYAIEEWVCDSFATQIQRELESESTKCQTYFHHEEAEDDFDA
jgi:hypothetical protein